MSANAMRIGVYTAAFLDTRWLTELVPLRLAAPGCAVNTQYDLLPHIWHSVGASVAWLSLAVLAAALGSSAADCVSPANVVRPSMVAALVVSAIAYRQGDHESAKEHLLVAQ